MIVVITSCAPTVALRIPAIPAQSAPASPASTMPTTTWRPLGSASPQYAPTQIADDDAHRVLALAADVEEAAAERERDGKSREREASSRAGGSA